MRRLIFIEKFVSLANASDIDKAATVGKSSFTLVVKVSHTLLISIIDMYSPISLLYLNDSAAVSNRLSSIVVIDIANSDTSLVREPATMNLAAYVILISPCKDFKSVGEIIIVFI